MSTTSNTPLRAAELDVLRELGVLDPADRASAAAFAELPAPAPAALQVWRAATRDAARLADGGASRQSAALEATRAAGGPALASAAEVWRSELRAMTDPPAMTDPGDRKLQGTPKRGAVDDLVVLLLRDTVTAQEQLAAEKLRRHARLISVGQVAASIGHDLRNPLGVIESSLFILRSGASSGDKTLGKHLDKIERQVKTCNQIIADLLDLAKHGPPRLELLDPADVFAAALEQASLDARIVVQTQAPADLRLTADPGLLTRALVNLLTNAARAMGPGGGTVRLEAQETAHGVELSVRDHGRGFPPELLSRAFEPLVTTHDEGIGLGLALVGAIAERHEGRAHASNPPGGGAIVTLVLPRREHPPDRPKPPHEDAP